ncbi:hypothetical protein [Aquimonas voraii]|uniref:Uncharacterized protein n=1 Tax=Aquimonas voraii TaxID=265719 RepID=A0A1G6TZL1_9GAMM|nr:hypothetical protein [Aquimonas voraii]SDD34501.1 hypothetical protein SAMN04488509_10288 [Aquimonas voraii]
MSRQTGLARGPSARSRLLVYGGVLAGALLVLFGPQLAEWGLSALGCPLGFGAPGAGCTGVLEAPARALVRWSQASPPLETAFVLFNQAWPLLLCWAAAVILSLRADRTRSTPAPASPRGGSPPHSTPQGLTPEAARARWIAARQHEQAEEALANSRALHDQLFAEAGFVGGVAFACALLICGLFAFCLAFGLPLLGGVSAEYTLHAFGCDAPAQAAMDPLARACGTLEQRLGPYRQPFFGALLSPLWLFTQFGDVLLLWLLCISALTVLPALRFGLRRLLRAYPPIWLGLIATACLAAIATVSGWLSSASHSNGSLPGPGDPVPALAFLQNIALALLVGCVLLVLATLACVAAVVMTVRARRNPSGPSTRKP